MNSVSGDFEKNSSKTSRRQSTSPVGDSRADSRAVSREDLSENISENASCKNASTKGSDRGNTKDFEKRRNYNSVHISSNNNSEAEMPATIPIRSTTPPRLSKMTEEEAEVYYENR
jgi:hypothetical protein